LAKREFSNSNNNDNSNATNKFWQQISSTTQTMKATPASIWSVWFASWWLLSSVRASATSVRAATAATNADQDHDHDRSLAVYALYNLVSFQVTFTTPATAKLLELQAQENPLLLSSSPSTTTAIGTAGGGSSATATTDADVSTLGYELRKVTQDFLHDRFIFDIAQAASEEAAAVQNSIPPSGDHYEIFDHLVAVDLQYQLVFANNPRQTEDNHVTLTCEMFGTVAFLEPHEHANKPTNAAVKDIFGFWMNRSFDHAKNSYLQKLVQTNHDLLRDVSSLSIKVFELSKLTNETSDGGWTTMAERALLAILILLSVGAVVSGAMFAHSQIRRRRSAKNIYDYQEYPEETLGLEEQAIAIGIHSRSGSDDGNGNGNGTTPSFESNRSRFSSMDAARHGSDTAYADRNVGAFSVLQASDRYLSKHRPDLYPPQPQPPPPPADSWNVLGRHYVIPSNPFESIFGAFSTTTGAATPTNDPVALQQRRSSFHNHRRSSASASGIADQQHNLAAFVENNDDTDDRYHDRDHDDDGDANDHSVPKSGRSYQNAHGTMSNIWRNITHLWEDDLRPRSSRDGIVMASSHDDNNNNNNMDMPVYPLDDEDYENDKYRTEEQDFDFAFQDFPRHDGTPCLMYNDNYEMTKFQKKHRDSSFSIDDDADEDTAMSPTRPVSDEVFAQMLSQHDDDDDLDVTNNSNNNKEEDDAEFRNKLHRIMTQRHRQYEKRSIVEKHREARDRERKQFREQERRDRHNAMEREIQAIEATLSHPTPPMHGNGNGNGNGHRRLGSGTMASVAAPKSPKRGTTTAPYSPKRNNNHHNNNNNTISSYSPRRQHSPVPHRSPKRDHVPHRSPKRDHYRTREYGESPVPISRRPIVAPKASANSSISQNGIFLPSPSKSPFSTSDVLHMRPSPAKEGQGRRFNNPMMMVPPEGFDDDDYDHHNSWSSQPPPHPLHVDTSASSSSRPHNKFMDDENTNMIMSSPINNPKYPSPNSIIDDSSSFNVVRKQQPQPSQAYSSSHRRHNSFNLEDKTTTQYGGHASYLTLNPNGDATSVKSSGGSVSSAASLSKQHRRVHSNSHPPFGGDHRGSIAGNGNGNGNGSTTSASHGHHRRTNSNNSHSDPRNNSHTDVLDHGIYAQTRFV
jgi:hypothetical protein